MVVVQNQPNIPPQGQEETTNTDYVINVLDQVLPPVDGDNDSGKSRGGTPEKIENPPVTINISKYIIL